VTFVTNATTASNAVLRSLKLKEGDAVLVPSTTYGAVKRTVHYICEQAKAKVVYVDFFKMLHSDDEVVKAVEAAITPNVVVALFDHIISETATILPIKRLIEVCKKRGVKVIIDGAHAVGQIPLNLRDLKPDYYFSNCHKWLCADRGCAFLYCSKENQSTLHPLNLSHGYGFGFLNEFSWTGTDDNSSYLSVVAAVKVFKAYGSDKIMNYGHQLALTVGHKCATLWGTELLASDEQFGMMVSVRVPDVEGISHSWTLANKIHFYLRQKHKIEAQFVVVNGKIQIRISAHMYHQESDYDLMAQTILEISRNGSILP